MSASGDRNPAVHPKPDHGRRSPRWPQVRAKHLERDPVCNVCGTDDTLEVHHIAPFHLHPELELAPDNLITLCEKNGHDCHFVFGHFHNWQAFNPGVVADSRYYNAERLTYGVHKAA